MITGASNENEILNKLLTQPTLKKNSQRRKLSINGNRKYQPKFQKPDVENLIQENVKLKSLIQTNNHTVSGLKVRNIQLEKKIKFLEKGLQKYQHAAYQTCARQDEKQNLFNEGFRHNKQSKKIQINPNTGAVHTEILKKKISDLTNMYTATQKELKALKKLPTATIYEQNDVEKQHLLAETVRLKAIISSLSEQLGNNQNEKCEKFQNQFMRLMKQQNQKLKATIRLLQNDKILLKSRQTIQNKLNADLKKQVEQMKKKILYKQSQMEKLYNENKNLLLKKTSQFSQEQQRKQNAKLLQLNEKLIKLQKEHVRIEELNEYYSEENQKHKEKQKNAVQEKNQIQTEYERKVKTLNDQVEELQFQLSNIKTDYYNLLNSGNQRKKKSMGLAYNAMKSSVSSNHRESGFSNTYFQPNQKVDKNMFMVTGSLNKQKYNRPVQWHQLSLAMLHVYYVFQQNPSFTAEYVVNSIQENQQVKMFDLIMLFNDQPFNMSRSQAVKLARFIIEDNSKGPNQKILYDQNACMQSKLAINVFDAALKRFQQRLDIKYQQKWQIVLEKSKKMYANMTQQLKDKPYLNKNALIQICSKYSRRKIQIQDIKFLVTKSFEKSLSEEQIIIDTKKFLQILKGLHQKNQQKLLRNPGLLI